MTTAENQASCISAKKTLGRTYAPPLFVLLTSSIANSVLEATSDISATCLDRTARVTKNIKWLRRHLVQAYGIIYGTLWSCYRRKGVRRMKKTTRAKYLCDRDICATSQSCPLLCSILTPALSEVIDVKVPQLLLRRSDSSSTAAIILSVRHFGARHMGRYLAFSPWRL